MNACIVSCLANVDLSKSVQSMKEKLAAEREPLARYFAATHDTKVKEEIERLLKEYGKLKEPWVFVVR